MTLAPDAPTLSALFQAADDPRDVRPRIAALPPSDRERLLAIADARWSGGGADARRATVCYQVLAEHLDPRTPSGVERIRRCLEGRRVYAPIEDLMRRTAADCLDDDLAVDASLLLATYAKTRAAWGEALELHLQALERTRGADRPTARRVRLSHAILCGQTGREVETLALAPALASLFAARGEAWNEVLALEAIACAYAALDDVVRRLDTLAALERVVGRLDGPRQARVRRFLHRERAELALGAGRADEAASEAALADEADRWVGGRVAPADTSGHVLRARVAWACGRQDDARAVAREVAARTGGEDPEGLAAAGLVAEIDLTAGASRGSTGVDARASVVEALERAERGRAASPVRRHVCRRLVEALERVPGCDDLVTRAFDAAALATIERVGEIDRFLEAMPAHATPAGEVRQAFDEARARGFERDARLRAALAPRIYRAGPTGPSPLAGPDGFVCVCAWCGRLRTPQGHWLPIQHLVPLPPPHVATVTHGICGPCRASAEGAASGGVADAR